MASDAEQGQLQAAPESFLSKDLVENISRDGINPGRRSVLLPPGGKMECRTPRDTATGHRKGCSTTTPKYVRHEKKMQVTSSGQCLW